MIEAYVPRSTSSTCDVGCCGEPVNIPGVGDMCHKIYAIVQENANLAERIQSFMFASKNGNTCDVRKDDPSCMTEELTAIMFELDRLHVILLDINSRL